VKKEEFAMYPSMFEAIAVERGRQLRLLARRDRQAALARMLTRDRRKNR
jgi:hypothetical protein